VEGVIQTGHFIFRPAAESQGFLHHKYNPYRHQPRHKQWQSLRRRPVHQAAAIHSRNRRLWTPHPPSNWPDEKGEHNGPDDPADAMHPEGIQAVIIPKFIFGQDCRITQDRGNHTQGQCPPGCTTPAAGVTATKPAKTPLPKPRAVALLGEILRSASRSWPQPRPPLASRLRLAP